VTDGAKACPEVSFYHQKRVIPEANPGNILSGTLTNN